VNQNVVLPGIAAEEGGDLGGVHAAPAPHPHHPAHPSQLSNK